ncbi:MAG TPA: alpha/beta hydrolase [Candidatus Dormibacteraeota bacterium]|nr:alpha/beta hydrolase [Candidatus Dormibacteraeota bacterium]
MAAGSSPGEPAADPRAAMGEPRWVEVLGRPARYLSCGEGEPILLAHGWIGSAENFHKWMPALAGRRRMVIPDLPGFGETPPLAGEHSIAALAGWLLEFADAAGLQMYDLGGLCLGGTVALEAARREPARVRQLVLHTPIYARRALAASFKLQTSFFLTPGVYQVASGLSRSRLVSDLYKRFFVEGADVDAFDAQVNFDNQVRSSPRAAREWLRDALRQDYEAWLRGWDQPVLMVVAADDHLLDLGAMQRLCEGMRTAEVVIVPDAGHGWNEALVRAQAAAISGFLSREPL